MKKLLSIIATTTILTGCMDTSLESIGTKNTHITENGVTYIEIEGECVQEKHEVLIIVKCKGNSAIQDHKTLRGSLLKLPPRNNKSTRYVAISIFRPELTNVEITLKAR